MNLGTTVHKGGGEPNSYRSLMNLKYFNFDVKKLQTYYFPKLLLTTSKSVFSFNRCGSKTVARNGVRQRSVGAGRR